MNMRWKYDVSRRRLYIYRHDWEGSALPPVAGTNCLFVCQHVRKPDGVGMSKSHVNVPFPWRSLLSFTTSTEYAIRAIQ